MTAQSNSTAKRSPLGPLPRGWTLATLKDLVLKVGSGATPLGGGGVYLSNREKYALIRSQNVLDRRFSVEGLAYILNNDAMKLRSAEVQQGDVLLNITGDGVTFGRSCIVPEDILPACVNQHVAIIRLKPDLCESGYLLSFFTHPLTKIYIESFNSGGSRRAVTKGHIEALKIPIPPLAEQQAIAQTLGALDDKIELNYKIASTLEGVARATFKSWFIDFDPVRAKADGRAPVGIDAATAALFPDSFEKVQGHEMPRGWQLCKLSNIANIIMGQSPPGDSYNKDGNGLPFYQGARDFEFRFPKRRVFCTKPTRFAQANDVLLSVRAPVGRLNIAEEKCAVGRGISAIRLKNEHGGFLYYLLIENQFQLDRFDAEGTVFGSVSKDDLGGMNIIRPDSALVKQFNQFVQLLDAQIMLNHQQSRLLEKTRNTLLPQLLSGKLRVRDAERAAEVVL